MIPRDYQRAAVDAAHDRTAEHGNTMLVLPTGAGKTAIAGFYLGEQADRDRNARMLVLQHTDELIEQNRSAIGHIAGLGTSVVKAEQDDWDGRVVFGSVQTLARGNRRGNMPAISHLVIDECHRAAATSYQSVIEHVRGLNPKAKLLGLQALAAADDFLRETETSSASAKSKRWLNDPATIRQIELLQRAGFETGRMDFGLSKYAANCHLNFRWNRAGIRNAVLRDVAHSAA